MAARLKGRKIAFLATDGVEQVELTTPWEAALEEGARTDLVSIKPGQVQAMNHDDKGSSYRVDRTVGEVRAADYDALVLPGGVANPDRLRTDERAVSFVRDFVTSGKPVAAICHGPWMLVEANCIQGRTLTSWPSLKTDIENAGGTWVDEQVHTESGIVTSRKPADLPAFCDKMVEEFTEGAHSRGAVATGASR